MRRPLAAAFLLTICGAGISIAAETRPNPCSSAEHRAFDFWVGSWRVENPDGKLAGHNTITKSHDGCVLQENWRGRGGLTGSSLNIYDAATKRWHQTWVDSSGALLLLQGAYANNAMQLSGTHKNPDGTPGHDRITWSRLPNGRVRQIWEQSPDGKSWTVAFDGTYIPEAK
jgi:hypothetical protein